MVVCRTRNGFAHTTYKWNHGHPFGGGRCRSKLDYDEVYRKSGIRFHREKYRE